MRRPLAVAFGLAMLLSGRVAAQTCMASTSGPTFGNYDPFAAIASSITGTVTVSCQPVVGVLFTYTIKLDGGTGGTIMSRAMSNGGSRLNYQLYTNAVHSAVWGDGTSGSTTIGDGYLLAVLSTVIKNYTVYGLIPARQMVPPGGYLDTVTVLVSY